MSNGAGEVENRSVDDLRKVCLIGIRPVLFLFIHYLVDVAAKLIIKYGEMTLFAVSN